MNKRRRELDGKKQEWTRAGRKRWMGIDWNWTRLFRVNNDWTENGREWKRIYSNWMIMDENWTKIEQEETRIE